MIDWKQKRYIKYIKLKQNKEISFINKEKYMNKIKIIINKQMTMKKE